MNTTDERQRAQAMGERLVALKGFLINTIMRKLGMNEHDAEDIYSETCVYMLDRGVKLIDMSRDYDAAITQTMIRRALNYVRNMKRLEIGHVAKMQERNHLAAPCELAALDWEIDRRALTTELLKRCTTNEQRALAEVFLMRDVLSIATEAERLKINKNTLHGVKRQLREHLKRLV